MAKKFRDFVRKNDDESGHFDIPDRAGEKDNRRNRRKARKSRDRWEKPRRDNWR